ncbi:substrate-binding domain-containing protein, partial [Vibrio sp. Vb2362]|nr:substrate-binding domain-containing protein [Vibrio sp. Vb2362]
MATMKDIAKLAGVSTSTVSHVINKTRFVSEEISERVNNAAKELNYYAPSALARSLKVNRTKTIGMLVTTSTNPFFGEVVKGVERSCYQKGYSLILCNTEGDNERMRQSINTLLQKRVDGLILMCSSLEGERIDVFERYPDIPVVVMDWGPMLFTSDKIQDNSLRGGYLAAKYLIDCGHTEIGCITGPLIKHQAQMRYEGYKRAMNEAGLEFNANWIIESDFECEGGYQAFKKMAQRGALPSSIFVSNDMMAMGVINAANELDIKVPDDLSIIGYDDIHIAKFMSPSLTTIHQPKYRLGQAAVETLVR